MNREQIIETMARGMFDACPPLRLTGEPIQWDDTKSFTPMNCRADAAAALSALEAAGLVVVPVEPSSAMIRDGVSYRLSTKIGGDNRWPEDTAALYTAMIKAALDPDRDSSG